MATCFHIGNKVVHKTSLNSWGFDIVNIDGSAVDEVKVGELFIIHSVLLDKYRMISEASELAALIEKVLEGVYGEQREQDGLVNKIDAVELMKLKVSHEVNSNMFEKMFELEVKNLTKRLETRFACLLLDGRFVPSQPLDNAAIDALIEVAHSDLREQAEKLFLAEERFVFPFSSPDTGWVYAALIWRPTTSKKGNRALVVDRKTYISLLPQEFPDESPVGKNVAVEGFPSMVQALNALLSRWW